jgi:lysophospholipase L1-like esterase
VTQPLRTQLEVDDPGHVEDHEELARRVLQIPSTVASAVAAEPTVIAAAAQAAAQVVNAAGLTAVNSVRASALAAAFDPPAPSDTPAITFTAGASTSTIPGATLRREKRIDSSSSALDLAGDARFRYDGTPSMGAVTASPTNYVAAPHLPGGTSQAAFYSAAIEFDTNASDLDYELKLRTPTGGYGIRITVDGKWLAMEATRATGFAAGSGNLMKLSFPNAKVRRVKVWLNGQIGWGGLFCVGDVTRPTTPIDRRLCILGDSFTGGAGSPPDGAGRLETWAPQVARLRAADSFWNFGIGGTGWQTSNPFSERVPAILAAAPHEVWIMGSRNDGNGNNAAVQAAVTQVLTDLASVPRVYVIGPLTSFYNPQNEVVKTATRAAGRVFLDGIGEDWINSQTTTYIGSDGVHPNFLGHRKIAVSAHESRLASLLPLPLI